jgi:superfamily II RNA helicase
MEGGDERLANVVRASLRQFQMRASARRAEEEISVLRAQLGQDLHGDEDEIADYLMLQANLAAIEKEQKRAKRARSKSTGGGRAARRYDRAREERSRLAQLLKQHPAYGRAMALEREDPERVAVLRAMNRLSAEMERSQQECDEQAVETAAAVRTVLTRLGYVSKRGLTRKARGLREIVAPSGIVLSEMYVRGVFDDLDAAELAEAISWFANDQDRRRFNRFRLDRGLYAIRRTAEEIFYKVSQAEEDEGINLAQGPSRWFHGVAYAWCTGASVEEIASRVELGEGDIVSVLNKTVDLLDQFEGMLAQHSDAHLLMVVAEAKRLLIRGLVAMVRSGDRLAEPVSA